LVWRRRKQLKSCGCSCSGWCGWCEIGDSWEDICDTAEHYLPYDIFHRWFYHRVESGTPYSGDFPSSSACQLRPGNFLPTFVSQPILLVLNRTLLYTM
jgi:hypothetical protein